MNPLVTVLRLLTGFSFKEKSLLISLLALLVVYGGYFTGVLSGEVERTLSGLLAAMIAVVIALVIVHVVFHIVIALDDVEEAEDERDQAVRRRAAVAGYNVLFVGVLLVLGRMLILGTWADQESGAAPLDQVDLANLLLAALVISELAYYGAQLYFYRRGFHD